MRKITLIMKLWLLYYKIRKWRTHTVFFVQYHCQNQNREKLYIGARKHGQSEKNLFHLNLRNL